ncbi:hypothetical protein DF016_10730 [Burkholderia stagnalis]|uniref:Uncharacterized protein n=1 Tax=Burkholderia stagnalis TaxID=1503054 RepID=A0ABX9YQ81_9BURK|nr:hypothetical protein DF017_12310 [Burkholderia stagnalis]RQZ19532.1 hypothetical protein DF016_10730 [Burkholderia stagnalis]
MRDLNGSRTITPGELSIAVGNKMGPPERTLDDEIFAVFERACREGNFAVAEHLLRALEELAHQQNRRQQLDRAYGVLAHR